MITVLKSRLAGILAIAVLLSGCATSSQFRSVDDGVYLGATDRADLSARQAAILNPRSYPFWSIDFFYFSHFYGPMRTRALYNPPLHPSIGGPCDRWARHLCLEEFYTRHLYTRLRAERDDFSLTRLDQGRAADHRIRALSAGAELHLMQRVSEARRTVAERRQVALQQQRRLDAQGAAIRAESRRTSGAQRRADAQHSTRLDARAVRARSAAQRDRSAPAQRMRAERSHSSDSRSSRQTSAARSGHRQAGSASRGSAATASSASASQMER
ncbi:MAG: hypothetical protein ACLFSC_04385 [Wenzhouxiangella sp.]